MAHTTPTHLLTSYFGSTLCGLRDARFLTRYQDLATCPACLAELKRRDEQRVSADGIERSN